jgi:hypothetical protein
MAAFLHRHENDLGYIFIVSQIEVEDDAGEEAEFKACARRYALNNM